MQLQPAPSAGSIMDEGVHNRGMILDEEDLAKLEADGEVEFDLQTGERIPSSSMDGSKPTNTNTNVMTDATEIVHGAVEVHNHYGDDGGETGLNAEKNVYEPRDDNRTSAQSARSDATQMIAGNNGQPRPESQVLVNGNALNLPPRNSNPNTVSQASFFSNANFFFNVAKKQLKRQPDSLQSLSQTAKIVQDIHKNILHHPIFNCVVLTPTYGTSPPYASIFLKLPQELQV